VLKNFQAPLLLEDKHLESLAKPEVLAFDLDLTLHDVISHYDHSINDTLIHFGKKPLTPEELNAIGDNFTNTKNFLANFISTEFIDDALAFYTKNFLNRKILPTSFIPGARELLYLIRKRFKLPIIAITNSEELIAKKILADLKIIDQFNYVVGIKEGVEPKPDPQMLIIALKSIAVELGPHVWLIGDRDSDTKCARETGCTSIRFYHYYKPNDSYADLFINSHYHLFNIISSKLKF